MSAHAVLAVAVGAWLWSCGGAQRCPEGDAAIPVIAPHLKRVTVRCSSDPQDRVRLGVYADQVAETWVECPPGQIVAADWSSVVDVKCVGHTKPCVRARVTCTPVPDT